MTNQPTDPLHASFLDVLRNTQQQMKALEVQYGQVSKEVQEQLARLARELEALRQRADDLQRQLDEVRSEKDVYLHSLHHLLRRQFTFTADELREMEQNRIPFSEIMEELSPP
jgi:hypothetical protein